MRVIILKYLKQFFIISAVSFLAEILAYFLPLPIPAGIYGIVILFSLLRFKILKIEQVREVAGFLIGIMPVLFISPAVGIINSAPELKSVWWKYLIISAVSTVAVMAVSGAVTQAVIKLTERRRGRK